MKLKYDVCFLLPMATTKIVGGYKVIYEYANYLAFKGLNVCIVYNSNFGNNSKKIPSTLVIMLRKILAQKGPIWFELRKEIDQIAIKSFDEKYLPDSSIYVSSTAESAIFLNDVKKSECKKMYFVQGYENWQITESELMNTYKYNMKIVTVAKWLKNIIEKYSVYPVAYVPNGVDGTVFKSNLDFYNRNKFTVSMLYHYSETKGADIGLKVLFEVKKKCPELEAYLFGSPKRNKEWPTWIHYKRNASPKEVCEVMNKSRIFLCTSRSEGYGLTVLESMFCGCAIISTKCGGITDFSNETNTILCEIDDVEGLAFELQVLLNDEKTCYQMAQNSLKLAQNRELLNSQKQFYQIIKDELE